MALIDRALYGCLGWLDAKSAKQPINNALPGEWGTSYSKETEIGRTSKIIDKFQVPKSPFIELEFSHFIHI